MLWYLDVAMTASTEEVPPDADRNLESGSLTDQALEVSVNLCTPINKL